MFSPVCCLLIPELKELANLESFRVNSTNSFLLLETNNREEGRIKHFISDQASFVYNFEASTPTFLYFFTFPSKSKTWIKNT